LIWTSSGWQHLYTIFIWKCHILRSPFEHCALYLSGAQIGRGAEKAKFKNKWVSFANLCASSRARVHSLARCVPGGRRSTSLTRPIHNKPLSHSHKFIFNPYALARDKKKSEKLQMLSRRLKFNHTRHPAHARSRHSSQREKSRVLIRDGRMTATDRPAASVHETLYRKTLRIHHFSLEAPLQAWNC
jgi:hypothetical protein